MCQNEEEIKRGKTKYYTKICKHLALQHLAIRTPYLALDFVQRLQEQELKKLTYAHRMDTTSFGQEMIDNLVLALKLSPDLKYMFVATSSYVVVLEVDEDQKTLARNYVSQKRESQLDQIEINDKMGKYGAKNGFASSSSERFFIPRQPSLFDSWSNRESVYPKYQIMDTLQNIHINIFRLICGLDWNHQKRTLSVLSRSGLIIYRLNTLVNPFKFKLTRTGTHYDRQPYVAKTMLIDIKSRSLAQSTLLSNIRPDGIPRIHQEAS